MRGTLWAACCGLCPPLNLCSVSLHSLHFSFFLPFSPSSCSEGKSYGVVYLFWFGVGSHMSLAGFHTSMTVAWIVRDYRVHMGVPLAVCINASAIVLAQRIENLWVFIYVCNTTFHCQCWSQVFDCQCISLPRCFGLQHLETHLSFLSLMCLSVLFMFLLREKPR